MELVDQDIHVRPIMALDSTEDLVMESTADATRFPAFFSAWPEPACIVQREREEGKTVGLFETI